MNRGGVETWLMHVLRRIDRRRIAMDFLVHTELPCAYDEEIRDLGSRILRCTAVHRPWRYVPELTKILRREGPFDVVHSHVHHFSGLILKCAALWSADADRPQSQRHATVRKPGGAAAARILAAD